MALTLSRADAARALDYFEQFIERSPVTYYLTDKPLCVLLPNVWRAQPRLRTRVAADLVQALPQTFIGERLLGPTAWIASRDADVADGLRSLADGGERQALLCMALAGIDHQGMRPEAQRLLSELLAVNPTAGLTVSFGAGYHQACFYQRWLTSAEREMLASHLLWLAGNTADPEINRSSATEGLRQLVPSLLPRQKHRTFARLRDIAAGQLASTVLSGIAAATAHPLSRFQFNLGSESLGQSALLGAAEVASTPHEVSALAPVISDWMARPDPTAVRHGLLAIGALPAGLRPPTFARSWAQHPNQEVRAAAAVLWARTAGSEPELGNTLATDPARTVRGALLGQLTGHGGARSLSEQRHLLSQISRDLSAEIRQSAREIISEAKP